MRAQHDQVSLIGFGKVRNLFGSVTYINGNLCLDVAQPQHLIDKSSKSDINVE